MSFNDVQGCAICEKLPLCCRSASLQNNECHISGFRACLQQIWSKARCSNKASTLVLSYKPMYLAVLSVTGISKLFLLHIQEEFKTGNADLSIYTFCPAAYVVVFLPRAQLFSEL